MRKGVGGAPSITRQPPVAELILPNDSRRHYPTGVWNNTYIYIFVSRRLPVYIRYHHAHPQKKHTAICWFIQSGLPFLNSLSSSASILTLMPTIFNLQLAFWLKIKNEKKIALMNAIFYNYYKKIMKIKLNEKKWNKDKIWKSKWGI